METITKKHKPLITEVYTENGWINIKNVKINDKIFTLNSNNNIEIQPISNIVKKKYNDNMYRFYNINLDMLLTKNHKIALWDRKNEIYTTFASELYDNLQNKNSITLQSYIQHSGNWNGTYEEFFTIPDSNIKIKSEDWAAFLGIYIAEGHCSGSKGGENKYEITITQVKSEQQNKILNLLDKLPFIYKKYGNQRQFTIKNIPLYNHLIKLGSSHYKFIPEYAKNWSKDLLTILLDWLLIGDGKNRKSRGKFLKEYFTTSPKLSIDVFEIMMKLGTGATISEHIPKDRFINDLKNGIKVPRLIKAENSAKIYLIHARTTRGAGISKWLKTELIKVSRVIYHIDVPNKIWLMKYNNKVSWTMGL
jgi:hypothetical protein